MDYLTPFPRFPAPCGYRLSGSHSVTVTLVATALLLAGCNGSTDARVPTHNGAHKFTARARLVALPGGASAPLAVYGNLLVWSQAAQNTVSCPAYHLFAADVDSFHPRRLWTGPPCDPIEDIRISRSWIVWSAGQAPSGTIWALYRATGKRFVVASQFFSQSARPCPTPACFPALSFSLDQNTLVWNHFSFGPGDDWMLSSIRSRVLPTGGVRSLYSSRARCALQSAPQEVGGRLVWVRARWARVALVAGAFPPVQCQGNLQSDVMTEMVGSHHVQVLTVDHTAYAPSTNGKAIMWEDSNRPDDDCLCYRLLLLNPGARRPKLLATDVVASEMTPNLAVWLTDSGTVRQVKALDMASRRVVLVASSGSTGGVSLIRVLGNGSGRRVVWERDLIASSYEAQAFVGIRDVPPVR